jgi:DNA processing protein
MLEDGGGNRPADRDVPSADREAVSAVVEECQALGIGVVGWFDDAFPNRLRSIPDPPAILFYRGSIGIANDVRSVAIVGTREPTGWGKAATEAITDRFALERWTVVSGLALGVDTIAHERALANHAPTVAVLGNGLSSIYPAANRSLAEQILNSGGLLLAEVPPHARVEARALVRRDRLQSGMAALTIVCQGSRKSGAMHTARYAAEQSRPLYAALPTPQEQPINEQDEGTSALVHEAAGRLPELLPAWRSATRRATSRPDPVALLLDEASLNGTDWLTLAESRYEPPSLF